jgi:hypothetical protein
MSFYDEWRENKALTPERRGLAHALELHRGVDPRQWRVRVDAIEDPIEKKVAEEYLHGIIARMKVARAANGGAPERTSNTRSKGRK